MHTPTPTSGHRASLLWLLTGFGLLLAACAQTASPPPASPAPVLRDVTPGVRPAPTESAPQARVPSPAALPAPPAPASTAQVGDERGGTTMPIPPAPAPAPQAPFDAGGSLSMEPGLYRCELNRRVVVRRIAQDGQSMVINWLGKDATLQAVRARTGALRFENTSAGLVWIVIVGKSMLLDSRAGRTLANDCKL